MQMLHTLRVAAVFAVVLALWVPPSQAACPEDFGNIAGRAIGLVDITDIQCVAGGAFAAMTNQPLGEVGCAFEGPTSLDLSGDGKVDLKDVVIAIHLALGEPLPPELDANGNGCPDAFETECGDAVCEDDIGESCLNCPFDCGFCPDLCCTPHDTPGCVQEDVTACVCAISSFCCEFFWDNSCAEVAVNFCSPSCNVPACPVAGTLDCGETISGSTVTGVDLFDGYGCAAAPFGGLERIYAFTPTSAPGGTFTLTPVGGSNVSLFVLGESCDSGKCLGQPGKSVTTPVKPGQTVYLVVDSPVGGGGAFELTTKCADQCDLNALCADKQCGSVSCAGLEFSCGTCPSGFGCQGGICEEIKVQGCPGDGECTEANGSPGCTDGTCCAFVCQFDPFCCENSWDSICADFAIQNCGKPCGDGVCNPAEGENCNTCWFDCQCGITAECFDGSCVPCNQEELCGSGCGTVFCGESFFECGKCAVGDYCDFDNLCKPVPSFPQCPSAGSCSESKPTPGCQDQLCCNFVCATDSFCCNTSWDNICANSAVNNCNFSCGNGICEPENGESCESCAADCSCAPGSGCFKGVCVPQIACPVAETVTCGSTIQGNLSGASAMQIYSCPPGQWTGPEKVYRFEANSGGQVTASLTPAGGLNATLLALGSTCNTTTCAAAPGLTQIVGFQPGVPLHFVVDSTGNGGNFALSVQCIDECDPQLLCNGGKCGQINCKGQNVNCGGCAAGTPCTNNQCFTPYPGCPGPGSCFGTNGSPSCDDTFCCSTVCPFDPFCCDVEWDSACVEGALQLCQ